MEPGLTASLDFTVTDADTADALLSGDLPVLATPRLLAWLEAATCAAVADHLEPTDTTVGTRIAVEHSAASAVGDAVRAVATLTASDGRTLTFTVTATDGTSGRALGSGEVVRAVVDRERFLGRVQRDRASS